MSDIIDNKENGIEFASIKIGLASPETIRSWSYGEVVNSETINYKTAKPTEGGLFDEKIFGPVKDYECHCGQYKKKEHKKGKVCEKCGVELTKSKVRRERMGTIELATPVSHIWYSKGSPSRICDMLDIGPKNLDRVLYYQSYIVTDPGPALDVEKYEVISEKQYKSYKEKYEDDFKAGMGAGTIKELLEDIDVPALVEQLREEIENATSQKKAKLLKRLEVAEAFNNSDNKPEWMILEVIPVIPPDLRPLVQLDGGRFACSDLNELYRRVINRNERLKSFMKDAIPDVVINNQKRMLQEAVDALINNGRRGRPVQGTNNRAYKSLSDGLKGKQGRFRQNLLGKRVDYSGRSVIVVGPELKMYQCGLPKEMALELFKPFVMKRLTEMPNGAATEKIARKMVDLQNEKVWDALEDVIKDHPVMLNRAPTLHRLGIQAFEPVLVDGRAIKLHPLACTAFNADFDGDQMAVHVPLSNEAQAEARFLMLAANNLLKPSDGRPITVPTQDMVLGSYYLTLDKDGEIGEGKVFRDVNEAQMAFDEGDITLHSKIKVRMPSKLEPKNPEKSALVDTTLGKIIFNNPIPQDLGFVDREDPEHPLNEYALECDFLITKKTLGQIIDRCIEIHGINETSVVLDAIKSQGYKYSTLSGITVAVSDAKIPEAKKERISETEAHINKIDSYYKMGMLSKEEATQLKLGAWDVCTKQVSEGLKDNLGQYNPIYMMIDSGARGSDSQLNQLAGMRGLIANTSGKTIEIPIRANYREGLNILEYFISSRGARKGLADTALRTSKSGYLTRRLVDVSQEIIIREEDCGCSDGIDVYDIEADGRVIEELDERLEGRYLVEDLVDEKTGELIQSASKMMLKVDAKRVANYVKAHTEEGQKPKIKIRSLLTCQSQHGVCMHCYGKNLATDTPVTVGEAIGIIAAQSIGEPGTQLTMRTFHTGGVASTSDITQGLPRVEELFEARTPKTCAILAEIDGTVSIEDVKKSKCVIITSDDGDEKRYLIPYGTRINQRILDGARVVKGETLTEGSIHPQDLLKVMGVDAVYDYLIREVQSAYRTQGVDINDKHIEVIIRQMMRQVQVDDPGETELISGMKIDKSEFFAEYRRVKKLAAEEGREPALPTYIPILLGITKAALATDSFLSAASFQETTKVLTEAAIKGKTDYLLGLKENVIVGKLLPSGTGMKCYNNVDIKQLKGSFNSIDKDFFMEPEIENAAEDDSENVAE